MEKEYMDRFDEFRLKLHIVLKYEIIEENIYIKGKSYCLTFFICTREESISYCIWWTAANRNVIGNNTCSIFATEVNAWINTFVVHTRKIQSTIRIVSAFWSTAKVGITKVVILTRTNSVITISICTTWAWIAIVIHNRYGL